MKNLEAMAKEMMGIEMNKLLSIVLLIFTSCNEVQETSSETEVEVSKSNVEAWVGTFTGVSPSYNMKNQYGEPMIINGNYITLPEIQYTYEIYDNNICSIYVSYDEGNYACHNVRYSVSSNNNNFSLTMHPESGSDCGGYDIILNKRDLIYNISEGGNGAPSFIVKKNN